MGRIIIEVIFPTALVIALLYLVYLGMSHLRSRNRLRKVARYAPELLRFENVDPRLAELVVSERDQLSAGINLVSRMLSDPAMLIPSEYADPLEEWVRNYRKELGK